MTHAAGQRTTSTDSQGAQSQQNADRTMLALLRELAAPRGMRLETLGDGWIVRLTRGSAPHEVTRHIYGYGFDLNPAATHAIACDKAATAELLARVGVPCIAHQLFLHPSMARFVKHEGTWRQMLEAFERWQHDVVVKENAGTGGRDVTRCQSIVELETAIYRLFAQTTAIAVCPYHELTSEKRFVMLRDRCVLAYEKVRTSVTGDGTSSVLELLAKQTRATTISRSALAGMLEQMDARQRALLLDVPPTGSQRLLNWRHNLGQGASVRLLSTGDTRSQSSVDADTARAMHVALQAAKAINLQFGSVDIVSTTTDPTPRVLEINAGVMMEFLARTLPEGPALAREVYGAALDAMFA
jgi:glutathione synthase/RimK-type ligase-like ATP-grasp enzyme